MARSGVMAPMARFSMHDTQPITARRSTGRGGRIDRRSLSRREEKGQRRGALPSRGPTTSNCSPVVVASESPVRPPLAEIGCRCPIAAPSLQLPWPPSNEPGGKRPSTLDGSPSRLPCCPRRGLPACLCSGNDISSSLQVVYTTLTPTPTAGRPFTEYSTGHTPVSRPNPSSVPMLSLPLFEP